MRTLQATVYIRVLGFVGDIIYSSYDGVRRLLARWKDERKKWLRRSEATKRGFNWQGPRTPPCTKCISIVNITPLDADHFTQGCFLFFVFFMTFSFSLIFL